MIVDTHIESWLTRHLTIVQRTFRNRFHRKFAGDVQLLMPFLPRCGVFLDVGANHGRYTLELSRVHSGDCRVLAFEPFDENYRILSGVTRARKNVECFHTALSDQEDECELLIPIEEGRLAPGGSFIPAADEWGDLASSSRRYLRQVVRLRTLDRFVAQHGVPRIDFIKMDVEGLETDVLKGARQTIARLRPKLAVSLYHETEDLLRLPKLVWELGDYDVYVRCKMEGPFSPTLYARWKD
ncbi:MAG: FkbM family methyltransferase [Planctomycetes bacterium]|nr:FkbM family methyltransferase [Planctomycetota bacterium]